MGSVVAYFSLTDAGGTERFVIKLAEQAKIDHARRILGGVEESRIHVQGTIIKETAPYNGDWNYYLLPKSIEFFENAIEVCDASIGYVEQHLDEVGGSFLPDSQWCPWSSRLVEEVTFPRNDGIVMGR